VIWQVKEHFGLERHRAKTLDGEVLGETRSLLERRVAE
jgi:hypothetical protein